MLAEAVERASSCAHAADVAIWTVQAVFFFFFSSDTFELFLTGVHNGDINLSGCAITDGHALFPTG